MPTNSDRGPAVEDRLTAHVEALVSGEDWAGLLIVACRFHLLNRRRPCGSRFVRSGCRLSVLHGGAGTVAATAGALTMGGLRGHLKSGLVGSRRPTRGLGS